MKGLGDALQVSEAQAGMWDTVKWKLSVRVSLNRSHRHSSGTEFSSAVTDLC